MKRVLVLFIAFAALLSLASAESRPDAKSCLDEATSLLQTDSHMRTLAPQTEFVENNAADATEGTLLNLVQSSATAQVLANAAINEEARQNLQSLKKSELRRKAEAAGASATVLDEAEDADDTKTAYIDLILSAHNSTHGNALLEQRSLQEAISHRLVESLLFWELDTNGDQKLNHSECISFVRKPRCQSCLAKVLEEHSNGYKLENDLCKDLGVVDKPVGLAAYLTNLENARKVALLAGSANHEHRVLARLYARVSGGAAAKNDGRMESSLQGKNCI